MRFIFGDIVVDSEQVELTKHAKKINCEPRVFELLVYFCNHPREAITREELVAQVWGGRIVSDAAVNRAVSELRKLLEADPSSPQLIKTVSKVGYKLDILPTLLENQPIVDNGHLTQTESDHSPQEEHDYSFTKKLSSKWFWLSALLALLIIFIYQVIPTQKHIEAIGVLERKPITSTMGNAFNPFYHTETNTLLFLYRADADSYAQIYMKKNQDPMQAVSHDDYYYTDVIYGTDGFIYASRLNNLQQRYCEIVQIDLLTKRFNSILDCGKGVVTQLVFDDKKRRLIYRSRPSISDPYALHSFQLDTSRNQQLTHPEQVGNNTGDYVFAISPNSQILAVVEYSAIDVDKIRLIDLSDNRIIASSPLIDNVYGLIWRSDNQILASNGDGLFEFETNNLTLITKEHSDQYGRLALGNEHSSILTERSQTTVNIFSYSRNQATTTPITASRGISLSPILGHHSNILAFKSNRTGRQEIYIQQEGKPAYIAEFEGDMDYINAIAWSPKDDKIVASINNTLYLYSLASQSWRTLAENYTQVHHVAFVQESIMFSADVDGQWNVWQLSLDNGKIEQVTTSGGYSVQGNANKLYFTKFTHNGLYQLDLITGIESALIETFPIAGWRNWQLRGDKIYYLLGKAFKEFDLTTGSEQIWHHFKGRKPNSCNVSYQYDFFACEQVELNTSNIWQFKLP